MSRTSTIVIGAGPAGLTAAYLLSKRGWPVTVLEADPLHVGGLARTENYKGYLFDIGGHRFFSKSREVEDLWTELLPHDMLDRPRSSRIYFRGKFYPYPLKAFATLSNLGLIETLRCVASYARAKINPYQPPANFEQWVTNAFGERLYSMFFKTYTEKVWGMECREISADWAAQRIKGLSLFSAVAEGLRPRVLRRNGAVIKTLIDSFRYPRRGPGMMWDACAGQIRKLGGEVRLGSRVVGCAYGGEAGSWSVTYEDDRGNQVSVQADHVVSSAPLRELVNGITPALSAESGAAANALKYRDFLTVVLIVRERHAFDDNWIYIHDPGVRVGRIQNFKSWSPEMVPDPTTACYGLEYFCFEGDGLWNSSDAELIELAAAEFRQIGLGRAGDVLDGCVVRQRKAYPVYDDEYAAHVETIRRELQSRYPRLHLVGRNGMHKYNNQDHAMMTAMLCVENIVAGREVYDLWQVNQDAEYHETQAASDRQVLGVRMVPMRIKPS